ncbi:ribosome maturation factor RimM [Corynebacterium cystitidis]|uniref:Ribosome maturation factor RimM n=1 Tax=Corynebacterium cystitidis DSM 20524 TaxID=1121357 RepID=A0A1H9NYE0_9CORY|nr:ribosome maturation factor RimM [Corynebacterium cystitidis]WJY82701.1 Ribosome maturation factor RimM [Corynebacterium cystitidis DSM 20524]SER40353.1 16S rRNA processing protein RimM [Corynebacterium cystitidis DSM 20524]SNV71628.1 16S rRNA-processing protein RimM [Corynebacterium cystitidis]
MELQIGRVVKSHGIKGEVVVDPTTDVPEIRFAIDEVLAGKQTGKEHELTVETVRPHKGRLLIKFREVPDRNVAETLRGTVFFAPPREEEDDDGFYDHELIGLKVVRDGEDIGEITGVMHTPGRQILEVAYEGREVLVPFVYDIVPEVDLEEGIAVVTPPEGLFEL